MGTDLRTLAELVGGFAALALLLAFWCWFLDAQRDEESKPSEPEPWRPAGGGVEMDRAEWALLRVVLEDETTAGE